MPRLTSALWKEKGEEEEMWDGWVGVENTHGCESWMSKGSRSLKGSSSL